jgi:hypothetical protein
MLGVAVSIKTVTPLPIAAVRRRVPFASVRRAMVAAPIWELAEKRPEVRSTGQMLVLYHGEQSGIEPLDGTDTDIGILLEESFKGDVLLQCVTTPEGRAAHARLLGGYHQLPDFHAMVRKWCLDTDNATAGPYWEHYSVWDEIPERRVTDVYYLLA